MQSKKNSLIESITNTLIGFSFGLAVQLVVFPFYGIKIDFDVDLKITFWFTLASIIRSYFVRRFFNKKDS